jgi:hypothetical protein
MSSTKYTDFFCAEHAEQKKLVLTPGIDVVWNVLFDDVHLCGLRSEKDQSAEVIKQLFACGKVATESAECTGSPPLMYFSPAKDFGWKDPAK